ncbi:MAG: glycosyltransferase [Cyanobacteria bacterium P01_F01_bin.42]
MPLPIVSIIIPVYNAEKWVAETIRSARDQTWSHTEILIIDDGSRDDSLAIARRFESRQIKVIAQPNQGASAARNAALAIAQGEFIQYLDADDLLAPNKIADQVDLLESSPPGKLSVCSTIHFQDGSDPDQGHYYDGLPFYEDSDDALSWLVNLWSARGMVQPAAWLMPREIADRVGGWNSELSLDDDGEYFARVILDSAGIRRSPTALTYYRKFSQGSSLSRSNSERGMWSGLKSLNLKTKLVLSQTQELRARKAIAALYMDWAMTAYPLCPQVTKLALAEIDKLSVDVDVPVFGGQRMAMMQRLLGWKGARYLSWHFQQFRARLQLT